MKVRDILKLEQGIQSVMRSPQSYPVASGFFISLNATRVSEAATAAEKSRILLIEKYAEKDDNGKMITMENNQIKISDPIAFSKELEELWDQEVHIDLHKINLRDLPEELPLQTIDALVPMIENVSTNN